ncbi:MAG: hypothetical protein PHG61_05075, partial [Candidatus Marinimicrobia bacterium]|nr:hypothetical protein [Candidatus Neomarinimicrobiota bacterium]
SGLSGLGESSRVVENGVIIAETPTQTFDQTYTQCEYGKVMGVSKRMWKFGIKKRDLTRVVNALKNSGYLHRERLLAHKYDAAWLTAYTESDDYGTYSVTTTGGDSTAMASTSHTREDGGTAWSNIVSDGTTSNMNLDYPGLKALNRIGSLIVDPKGNPMPMNYNRIVTKMGTSAAHRAKEILGAIKSGKIPGEFSNDAAAVGSFELVENPFLAGTGDATSITNLSSATNWHAIDTAYLGDEYGPQYFESQDTTLEGPNVVKKMRLAWETMCNKLLKFRETLTETILSEALA